MYLQMIHKLFAVYCLLITNVISQESNTDNKNSTDGPIDTSFNFDEFDQNGQNKVIINLNQNCSTHDDCTAKHSICESTRNTCECDITSMQTQSKCRVIYCQSNEECSMRFSDSMCSFGRCQCISGHKVNGKCLRGMIGSSLTSGPLPDWAIISIAVTLCLSVIAGGSFKKKELRQHLIRLIRLILFRGTENPSQNQSCEEAEDEEESKRSSKKEDIEMTAK